MALVQLHARRAVAPPQAPKVRRRRWVGASAVGPAFVAAVAYVDPGNFATNFQWRTDYG